METIVCLFVVKDLLVHPCIAMPYYQHKKIVNIKKKDFSIEVNGYVGFTWGNKN